MLKALLHIAGTSVIILGFAFGLGLAGILPEPATQGILGGVLPTALGVLGLGMFWIASLPDEPAKSTDE